MSTSCPSALLDTINGSSAVVEGNNEIDDKLMKQRYLSIVKSPISAAMAVIFLRACSAPATRGKPGL